MSDPSVQFFFGTPNPNPPIGSAQYVPPTPTATNNTSTTNNTSGANPVSNQGPFTGTNFFDPGGAQNLFGAGQGAGFGQPNPFMFAGPFIPQGFQQPGVGLPNIPIAGQQFQPPPFGQGANFTTDNPQNQPQVGNDPNNPFSEGGPGLGLPWNSLPVIMQQLQALESVVPGISQSVIPGMAGLQEGNRANFQNVLGTAQGVGLANDSAGILGDMAGPFFGSAAGITAQLAANQNQATQQALGGIQNASQFMQMNPGVMGTQNVLSQLAQNPFPTSNANLLQQEQDLIRRRAGTAREGALTANQDFSAASGTLGGESAALQAGVDAQSRADLADQLAESNINNALRRSQDTQNTLQGFGAGAQNLGASVLQPQALLSEAQANSQFNPFTNSLIEQIRQIGALGLEDAQRESVSSGFGELGGLLGGIGSFIGGATGLGGIGSLIGSAAGGALPSSAGTGPGPGTFWTGR